MEVTSTLRRTSEVLLDVVVLHILLVAASPLTSLFASYSVYDETVTIGYVVIRTSLAWLMIYMSGVGA
jgi:hypothetical protein